MVKKCRRFKSLLFYLALFLVTGGMFFVITKSMEEDVLAKLDQETLLDYSRSNIVFYNPKNGCTTWGKIVASGDTVEEMILSALKSSGLTDAQVIGVYANIRHEAVDNPVRHEYSFINGGCWSPQDANGDGLGECSVTVNGVRRYYNNIVLDKDGHWDLFNNTAPLPVGRKCLDNECQSYGIGLIGFSYGWRVAMLEYIQERDPELIEYFQHPELYNNLSGDQLINEIGKDVVARIVALQVEEMLQYGDTPDAVEQLPSGDGVDVAVQSAGIWSDQVERCGNCHVGMAQYELRQNEARQLFDQLNGKVLVGSKSLSYCSTAQGTRVPLENGGDGGYTEDGFTYYLQAGPTWGNIPYLNGDGSTCYDGGKGRVGTIGTSGCGPTAMAMIITALTGKQVSPIETAQIASGLGARACGSGSSGNVLPLIGTHYGLKYEYVSNPSISVIEGWLNRGAMLIFSVGGEYSTVPYGPLTNIGGGHFIAIRGRSEDGKWLTFDSSGNIGPADNNKPRSDRKYEPDQLLKAYTSHGRGNMYAIYK